MANYCHCQGSGKTRNVTRAANLGKTQAWARGRALNKARESHGDCASDSDMAARPAAAGAGVTGGSRFRQCRPAVTRPGRRAGPRPGPAAAGVTGTRTGRAKPEARDSSADSGTRRERTEKTRSLRRRARRP
jgi:hypothetical protein